jgi:hypothetical protein
MMMPTQNEEPAMSTRPEPTLEALESAVLGRIAAHRASRNSAFTLSVALAVAITALACGVLTGIGKSNHPGSEAALLDDDVGLAPSSLLASN